MDFGHRGLWSTMLTVLGIILLYIAFAISKGHHLGEEIVTGILYLSSILSLLGGVGFGIKGILEREDSVLKYVGIILVIVLIITLITWPFILNLISY